LLPNTDSGGGMVASQALTGALEWLCVEHAGSPIGRVSVSIGIGCTTPASGDDSAEDLVAAADKALYAAKANGRNRAVAATEA